MNTIKEIGNIIVFITVWFGCYCELEPYSWAGRNYLKPDKTEGAKNGINFLRLWLVNARSQNTAKAAISEKNTFLQAHSCWYTVAGQPVDLSKTEDHRC